MTRQRRPRGSLNPDVILDAAEVLASQGFDALTMRAVAARLDAVPMALYNHFATKDELVDALLDRVLTRFEPAPPTGDWIEDLRVSARTHRRLLVDDPWAVAPLFTRRTRGSARWRSASTCSGSSSAATSGRPLHRRLQRPDRPQLRLVVVHHRRRAAGRIRQRRALRVVLDRFLAGLRRR